MPAKVDSFKIIAKSTQVELPKAPAVPASSSMAFTYPAFNDPQADLTTAIPDIVRLVQAGRQSEIYRTYTPSENFDAGHYQEMQMQEEQWDARVTTDLKLREVLQERKDTSVQLWEALEKQTPDLNNAGDEATYTYIMRGPNGESHKPVPRIFIKIDGKWYLKP